MARELHLFIATKTFKARQSAETKRVIQIQLQQNDPSAALPRGGAGQAARPFAPFGEDGLTFADFVDIINPLQHIPVIGTYYRKLTGDQIDPAMRIAGGALFGGPIGAALSAVAVAVGEAQRLKLDAAVTEETALADDTSENARVSALAAPVTGTNAVVAGRPAASRDSDSTASRPTASTDDRQPRRGGWIVAFAYGDELKSSRDNRSGSERRIDLSV